MRRARVRVVWEASRSLDVVGQRVTVTNLGNGEELLYQELGPTVTEVVFDVDEKTSVNVEVVVTDGTFDSEPTTLSFSVGDLTAPLPVSGLDWEVLEVVDVDEVA